MPAFHVRFKGMLTGQERERLTAAGLRLQGSESSLVTGSVETGIVRTGRRIYTVIAEANSPEEALARVRNAIEPDTANFVNWEVEAG
jgi:hypothetical protein